MYILLISLLVGLFVALLFVNLYFRMKVLRAYRKLVQAEVEFTLQDIFDQKKLSAEVLPRYPQHQEDILSFVRHIRYSVRLASVLVLLITLIGGVMMYFRE